jgi:uncharacterized membrane protein
MPIVSIVFGVLLIGLGVWGYSTSDLEGNLKLTALIPAAVGTVLAICGAVALVERYLKHAMHVAATVGLIGLLLAAGRFVSKAVKDGVDLSKTAPQATLAMLALCLVFVGLCVNSFIQARRRRAAREAAGQPAP